MSRANCETPPENKGVIPDRCWMVHATIATGINVDYGVLRTLVLSYVTTLYQVHCMYGP